MKRIKDFSIARYTTHIEKAGMGSGKARIVFLSDRHNAFWGENDAFLMALIDREKPDMVLCGGDMLVAYPGRDVSEAAGFLNRAGRRWPTFCGLGNHEYRLRLYPETYGDMYRRYTGMLDKEHLHILDDRAEEYVINGISFMIYGFSVKRKFYHRFKNIPMPISEIHRVFGRPDSSKVSVLMAHTPKYIKTYFKWGADITLSGHYHGGMMRFKGNRGLISPDLKLFPHNAHGLIRENGKTMIISAGLGEHTIPVRINNPRELVVLDISVN